MPQSLVHSPKAACTAVSMKVPLKPLRISPDRPAASALLRADARRTGLRSLRACSTDGTVGLFYPGI